VDGPSKPIKDPRGRMHMGASARTQVNRADFGMTGASGMVGNDVSIEIDVEMVKAGAGGANQ
jgi:polyisoprenoid-binding protein YceI